MKKYVLCIAYINGKYISLHRQNELSGKQRK